MKVILCLDYSPFTEEVLATMHDFLLELKHHEITVIHILDERLILEDTGFETQLEAGLKKDSESLKKMCIKFLGEKVQYMDRFGHPKEKIDEILASQKYDLLAIGSHSRSILGVKVLGGVAEHLLRNSKKPVFVIP
jgi:nucleotide-binding universal stress UspA family protein